MKTCVRLMLMQRFKRW